MVAVSVTEDPAGERVTRRPRREHSTRARPRPTHLTGGRLWADPQAHRATHAALPPIATPELRCAAEEEPFDDATTQGTDRDAGARPRARRLGRRSDRARLADLR